jgi:hypothetical protein
LREGIDTLRGLHEAKERKREPDGGIHDAAKRVNDKYLDMSKKVEESVSPPNRAFEMELRKEVSGRSMDAIKDRNLETLGRLDQLGKDLQRFGTESPGPSSGTSGFESRWSGAPNSPIPSRTTDRAASGSGSSGSSVGGFEQRWAAESSSASRPSAETASGFASRWSASGSDPSPAPPAAQAATSKSGSAAPTASGRFEERWGSASSGSPTASSVSPQPSGRYPSQGRADAAGKPDESRHQGGDSSPASRINNTGAVQCIEFVEVPDSGGWFYNRCSQPVHYMAQKYAESAGRDPAGWFTGSSSTLAPGARKGIVLGTNQTFQWSACEASDRNCVSTLERLDNDGNSRRREEFCGLLRPLGLACRQASSSPPRGPSTGPSYGKSWSGDRSSSGSGPRTYPSSPSGGARQ